MGHPDLERQITVILFAHFLKASIVRGRITGLARRGRSTIPSKVPAAIAGLLVAALGITALGIAASLRIPALLIPTAVPIPFGIPEVDVIGYDLSGAALVAFSVGPVPHL